jgi:ABC-2 type transport system ATP-binding protein
MMQDSIIETRGLTKAYGRKVAVDELTFSVQEGEIFGFLGPNGAGKTTTILMLLGLSVPTKGDAVVCGFDPTREAIKVKRLVGYLPEYVGFYEDMTAKENLRYVGRLNRITKEVLSEKIEEALEIVGLSDESDRKVGVYSRGMRQRLGIAEVLVKEPEVVFLDEPTLGLDPDGSNRMIELIQRLSREKGITVFFSSHYLHQVQRISDRIGIMIHGKMVAMGPIEQLAREKFGVDEEEHSLEEIYMKYFQEV